MQLKLRLILFTGEVLPRGITFHGHDGSQNYNDETLK